MSENNLSNNESFGLRAEKCGAKFDALSFHYKCIENPKLNNIEFVVSHFAHHVHAVQWPHENYLQ